jgi:RNA polymerase sigma factor (sigma-70 family)
MSSEGRKDALAAQAVFVVDDDDAMRESLEFLLESVGIEARSFESALEFLEFYRPEMGGCLLLDVRIPGMGGLELQEKLRERGCRIPVIIMTAYADVPMAVRAMRAGAVDFIEKPFNDQQLLDRVHQALEHEIRIRREQREKAPLRSRFEQLTPREREILELVVEGHLNKQIASQLGLSIKTVEQHRARVMAKTGSGSLAELVRMAIAVGVI